MICADTSNNLYIINMDQYFERHPQHLNHGPSGRPSTRRRKVWFEYDAADEDAVARNPGASTLLYGDRVWKTELVGLKTDAYQGAFMKSGVFTCCMYSTVQYSTVQYSTVQYSTVQYSTVQYSTVQYSTVHAYISNICLHSMLLFIVSTYHSLSITVYGMIMVLPIYIIIPVHNFIFILMYFVNFFLRIYIFCHDL